MKTRIALLLLGSATPALAQHAGHTMPAQPAPQPDEAKKDVGSDETADHPSKEEGASDNDAMKNMDHGTMDHGAMEGTPEVTASGNVVPTGQHTPMEHRAMEAMDHSQMDHSQMDMGAMDHSAMPIPDAPPPPAAGTGPARAADAIWGAEAMRGARDQLREEQGGQNFLWFMVDRAEYRLRDGRDGYLWDVQGYYGGDINKFWFKSEGEGSFGEKIESAEVQALYSRAIGPWFDLQTGVRQDLAPRDRTYAVVGIQGLAPYMFEVDAAVFLSDKGDLTARFEGELDQRITQRLILQPRTEVNLATKDIPELGIGAGIDTVELGLRLRYEFAREFAPYIGVEQEWKVGQSADYARARGEDSSVTNYVVGVRFWF